MQQHGCTRSAQCNTLREADTEALRASADSACSGDCTANSCQSPAAKQPKGTTTACMHGGHRAGILEEAAQLLAGTGGFHP